MKIERTRLHQIIREEILRARAILEAKEEDSEEESEVQPDGFVSGPDTLASSCGCGCPDCDCGCK